MDERAIRDILKTRRSGYRLGRMLGNGNFGVVYELGGLREEAVLKIVSIKDIIERQRKNAAERNIFIPDWGHIAEEFAQRQNREILSLRELSDCPYVVKLLDDFVTGTCPEEYTYFMIQRKYQCLQDFILNQPVTEGNIRQMAEDILQALVTLEDKKMIHRDIKPDNIFIQWVEGNPRFLLGDFGLARHISMFEGYMVTAAGTLEMQAPEVLQGRAFSNSDLYSLGCTMFYIMTGQIPNMIMSVKGINAGFADDSDSLRRLIQKAIQWEPKNRYKDARAMLQALEEVPRHSGKLIERNYTLMQAKRVFLQQGMQVAGILLQKSIKKLEADGCSCQDNIYLSACYRLLCYIILKCEGDEEETLPLLKELTAAGDAVAQYLYGSYLLAKQGRKKEGVQNIRDSAQNGCIIACYTYGRMLCQGEGYCDVDMEKGISYLEAACINGYIPAVRYLQRIKRRYPKAYLPDPDIAEKLRQEIDEKEFQKNKDKYAVYYL